MVQFFHQAEEKPCVMPGTLSLEDCLACRGCITSEEVSSFAPDITFLDDRTTPLAFIISPQVKQSLHSMFPQWSFTEFEKALLGYLHKVYSTVCIVDTSCFEKRNAARISSECPAVVLYVERVFPSLIPFLATEKTFQQIAYEFVSGVIDEKGMAGKAKVVSIMQCYDKKDESRKDGTAIDYFVGARDFYVAIKDKLYQCPSYVPEKYEKCHGPVDTGVSGMAQCINILKKLKNDAMPGQNCIELRICKGGCLQGPVQLSPGNLVSNIDTVVSRDSKICIETGKRVFTPRKKNVFEVEW